MTKLTNKNKKAMNDEKRKKRGRRKKIN